jgi:DNA-binding MarR family transcriptional regulator
MQPSRCNFAALRRAMRRMNALYDEVLAPCGLRSTQYTLMSNIGRLDRPAVTQLAEELVMDRSALAHTLQTLQREGLVEVTPDPRDRRTKRVKLTAAGAGRLAEADALWREGQDRFEAAIGPGPADDLREMMDRLASTDFAQAFKAGAA